MTSADLIMRIAARGDGVTVRGSFLGGDGCRRRTDLLGECGDPVAQVFVQLADGRLGGLGDAGLERHGRPEWRASPDTRDVLAVPGLCEGHTTSSRRAKRLNSEEKRIDR